VNDSSAEFSDAWSAALESIKAANPRAEIALTTTPAPADLAPNSIAFAADIHPAEHGVDSELGQGRFIVLHDESEPDPWQGPFRVVCYAQAPLEREIGSDPLLPEVAWSWLIDALAARGARYHAPSGTATTVLSKGFGSLAAQGDGAQIELRASWSPDDSEIGVHLEAWGDFLCALAGLPPAEGVASLTARRATRGR